MTLTSSVGEGCELLQSYGEKSNATLLLDYGFVLPHSTGAVGLSLPSKPRDVMAEVSGHDFTKLLPLLRAGAASEDSGPRSVEVRALGNFKGSIQQALGKLPKLDVEGAGSQPDSDSDVGGARLRKCLTSDSSHRGSGMPSLEEIAPKYWMKKLMSYDFCLPLFSGPSHVWKV